MDLKTASNLGTLLDEGAIQLFRASLQGRLLRPGDDDYEQARKVWNGMFDRHPALIARCASASDVVSAVTFARRYGLLVSVKGGGHSFAGHSVCDNGLVIDLSPMNKVDVDPDKRTARAESGALLGDLDQATQAYGLATPAGVVSHTGIAGLTLGGGQGYLMNKFGLTIDNLLSVDIVLADGRLLKASATENEDLFWAVRGGGGNFGVITAFDYQLHPVGPEVLAGLVIYPMTEASRVLRFYREFSMNTPDELSVLAGLLFSPDGHPIVAVGVCWIGEPEEGLQQLKPLREFGTPLADTIGTTSYCSLQTMFDAAFPHGMHRYAKSGYLTELSDAQIDTIAEYGARMPSVYSMILLNVMKGATARVDPAATAFPHRRNQWYYDSMPQWTDPADAGSHIAWTKELWSKIGPETMGASTNFFSYDDGQERVKAAYGSNYNRLVDLKTKYDPENFFQMNNNIIPRVPVK